MIIIINEDGSTENEEIENENNLNLEKEKKEYFEKMRLQLGLQEIDYII